MSYSNVRWLSRLRQRRLDKPFAATMGEWRRWRKEAKTAHPGWYFILEAVPDFIDDLISPPLRKLRDLKYGVMYRIHPRHRYHVLKIGTPGYYDPCSMFLPANFAILERYIEERGGVDGAAARIDWLREAGESPEYGGDIGYWHEAEALSLWLWWTIERPNRVDPWDSVGEPEDIADGEGLDEPGEPCMSRRQFQMMNELEGLYTKDDEEQLIRLIKIREYLWA